MTTFKGTDIDGTIRQILDDADKSAFTDPQLVVNINAGIRAVLRDVPASRFSNPVSFRDSADITALADTINLDIRWKDAVIHYAASRCFADDDRHTNNLTRRDEELKQYEAVL